MVQVTGEYPAQYETELVLKDGSTILVRPIKSTDADKWLAFIKRLNTHTKYLRFHHVPGEFTLDDARRFCSIDYKNSFAFIAESGHDGQREIVAIGRYYRLPDRSSAEVAFVTEEAYQDRGIASGLMKWLVNVARDNGIIAFEADVLAENETMLSVFRDYGFHIVSTREADVNHVTFPLTRTRKVLKLEEERERTSLANSVRDILYPRSVAVIGASRKQGTIGRLLVQCILQGEYTGTLYPVNPNAESIMAIKAYPKVSDIPGEVDIAVIAVPAPLVAQVAEECGRKGVRAIIVISDGFKEAGPEGNIRERELRDITLCHGMRLVGPNCMGIINTDRTASLNATFSTVFPPRGNVAFLSQSGAMGLVVLEYAAAMDIGISSFISVGNRADISSNDLLQYWEQDPSTKVILLYLESFGNPVKFSRIARRVSARKPILVVKGGRTPAGYRAASSHTGAMATSEIASEALFHQAGIVRLDSIGELFDVAALLSSQPLPRGRRLLIATNGGGPGIIAADACANQGLKLPEPGTEFIAKISPDFHRDIRFNNPLDLTAAGSASEFESALRAAAEDANYDACLVIFIPPVLVEPEAMTRAINKVAPLFRRAGKPLLACFMGRQGFKARLGSAGQFVPCYLFPEDAVSALARAADYAELRKEPKVITPRLRGIKRAAAQEIIASRMRSDGHRPLWLSSGEVARLLASYGIRFIETESAASADEAAAAAGRMGFPVAVKLASSTITHKSDVGGVILGLDSEQEVRKAFATIQERLTGLGRREEMEGVTVQRMVEEGVETIVGVTQDPSFGPVILFGLGGTYAELMKDIAVKLHPLSAAEANELIHSVKMVKLLEGFRGSPPSDIPSLIDLLLRVSAMVEDLPEIGEMDFNPVKVMPMGRGYVIVDARIMLR